MAEGGIGVGEAGTNSEVKPYDPIRVDLSQVIVDPGDNATPDQRESFVFQKRVREIIKEAGAEPGRGTPYVEAGLAEMGLQIGRQPTVEEKIALQLKDPSRDFGPSLTPEGDHAMYLVPLEPIPAK